MARCSRCWRRPPNGRPHVWSAASIERPPAERAGGAEFGHIRLEHQRELKRQVLEDALAAHGEVLTDEIATAGIDGGRCTSNRSPVRQRTAQDGAPASASRSTGTAASDRSRRARTRSSPSKTSPWRPRSSRMRRRSGRVPRRGVGGCGGDRSRHIHVLVNDAPDRSGNRSGNRAGRQALAARTAVRSRLDRGSDRRGNRTARPRQQPVPIRERVGDREFRLDARGFWQVHRAAAETLTAAVAVRRRRSALRPSRSEPRPVRRRRPARRCAGGPLRLHTPHHVGGEQRGGDRRRRREPGRLGRCRGGHRPRGALHHPSRRRRVRRRARPAARRHHRPRPASLRRGPRRGRRHRLASTPAQVVYVACDPVALARDLAYFAGHGYRLQGMRAFDLFPNTHHIEAVATLTR